MRQQRLLGVYAVALLVGSLGCQGLLDGRPGHAKPYILSDNGLSLNGLIANGLQTNGLRMNGLRMNGLRMNGLRMNGFSINDLSADDSDNVMTYLVGCALPPEHSLTIYDVSSGDEVPHTWWGALGLGTQLEWDALTDPVQQGWVSACMLAHANSLPQKHVMISVRGGGVPLDGYEALNYPVLNGAFWGNLFSEPAQLEACASDVVYFPPDVNYFNDEGRNCAVNPELGTGPSPCFIEVVGQCSDNQVCSPASDYDGSYPGCGGSNEVITVFLAIPPPNYNTAEPDTSTP
jgi:hypothetical protein